MEFTGEGRLEAFHDSGNNFFVKPPIYLLFAVQSSVLFKCSILTRPEWKTLFASLTYVINFVSSLARSLASLSLVEMETEVLVGE